MADLRNKSYGNRNQTPTQPVSPSFDSRVTHPVAPPTPTPPPAVTQPVAVSHQAQPVAPATPGLKNEPTYARGESAAFPVTDVVSFGHRLHAIELTVALNSTHIATIQALPAAYEARLNALEILMRAQASDIISRATALAAVPKK